MNDMLKSSILGLLLLVSSIPANASLLWEIRLMAGISATAVDEAQIVTSVQESSKQFVSSIASLADTQMMSFSTMLRFNQGPFIETGWVNLGNVDVQFDASVDDIQALETALIGSLPGVGDGYFLGAGHEFQIAEAIWLSTSAGLLSASTSSSIVANSASGSQSITLERTQSVPYLALGLNYQWFLDSALHFEAKHYQAQDTQVTALTCGISLLF